LRRGSQLAHYASLVLAFGALLYIGRRQWFFYDEWEFLATRGLGGQSLRLFAPHNEHWSTIPILVFRGLYAVVGLRSYLPYLAVLLLLHVTIAYVVWRLMLRAGAGGWVATALAAIFLFLGGGYENIIWAFQIGFLISTLCGLVMLILADHGDRRFGRRDAAVWAVGVAGLMSSGVGVTMVGIAGVTALLRRGWRAALATVSVPALVYFGWLALEGHRGLSGTHLSASLLVDIPAYVWNGLTGAADLPSRLSILGAAAVVAVLAWCLLHHRAAAHQAPAFAGAIGAVLFFVVTGLGRVQLGASQASSPRYVYVATALLLPIVAVMLSAVARRGLITQLGVGVLILLVLAHNAAQLTRQARDWASTKQQEEQQILAGSQLLASGARVIGEHPDPMWAPDLTTTDLATMVRERALPTASDLTATNRLDAMLALYTELSAQPLYPLASLEITAGNGTLMRVSPSCFQTTLTGGAHAVLLQFTTLGSVEVISPVPAGGGISLATMSGARSSDSQPVPLAAKMPVFIDVARAPVQLTLTALPDAVEICGAPLPPAAP